MYAAGKSLGKSCLKAIRDTFFCNMWSVIRRGPERLIFLVGDIKQEKKVQTFGFAGRPPPPPPPHLPPLVGHPDLPIRKTLRRVLVLLTVMILKRVSESSFFLKAKRPPENPEEGAWSAYCNDFEKSE